MAKLTFTLTTAAGTVTQDSPKLTDQQMARFTDWLWTAYPQINPDGTTKTKNAANQAQAFRDWSQALWRGTKASVANAERDAAANAARNAVQDVVDS